MSHRIVTPSAVPKHRQLADLMVADIRDGKFRTDGRFLSEHEWAARLKVSRQTVRLAMDHLARDGFLRREQGRGTFVTAPPTLTERKAWRQSRDIGVLVSCVTRYSTMLRAVEDVCKENGFHLLIGNSDTIPEKEKNYIREWVSKPLAGAVLFPSYNSRLDDYRPLKERNMPFVLGDTNIEGLDADLVTADNENGAREGLRALIRHGCRRIPFLSGYFSASTSRARLEGYRAALEETGLPFDRALVMEGGFTPEFGYAATCRLLERFPDADGLFVANAPITVGVVYALLDKGRRVPDDIKICTFDEPPLPYEWHVPLIMVKDQHAEEARVAASLLMKRIGERRAGAAPRHATVVQVPVQVVDMLDANGKEAIAIAVKRVRMAAGM